MTCTYSDEIINAFTEYAKANAKKSLYVKQVYYLSITFNGITYKQSGIVNDGRFWHAFSSEPQFMRLFVDWYLNNQKP